MVVQDSKGAASFTCEEVTNSEMLPNLFSFMSFLNMSNKINNHKEMNLWMMPWKCKGYTIRFQVDIRCMNEYSHTKVSRHIFNIVCKSFH